ncbi:MAG: hypothetical protein JXR76_06485 [Deltaproteobacteria bacterium]|nr:hypothetical protein [Deltaproteobacteria bacterium]
MKNITVYKKEVTGLKPMIATTIAILALCTAGCFDFEPNHMVTKFKVLAVQAEPPEIAPGEGFDMEVLYADPGGRKREITFAWFLCVNRMSPAAPLKPQDTLAACELVQTPQVQPVSNDGHIFIADQTPEDIMSLYPQQLLSQPGGVPLDAQIVYVTAVVVGCAGGHFDSPEKLQTTMYSVNNPTDLCNQGDGFTTYKVLRVTPPENPNPNENPKIVNLVIKKSGDSIFTATGVQETEPLVIPCKSKEDCGAKLDFEVTLSPDSLQMYHVKDETGFKPIEEVLYVTWFTTGGDFDGDRSIADTPTGPYERTWETGGPGRYRFWAVAHDVRGGIAWKSFEIQLVVE